MEERSPSGWEPLDIDLSSAPTTVQQCFGGGVMYGEGDQPFISAEAALHLYISLAVDISHTDCNMFSTTAQIRVPAKK